MTDWMQGNWKQISKRITIQYKQMKKVEAQ